jgi:subtilisin-like proprotein convertase family protein/acetylornithine deacetylase/succinyl-diaminopimelate desuccinylase-like protein
MRRLRLIAVILLAFEFLTVLAAEPRRDLVVADHAQRPKLEALDLAMTFKGAGFFLGEWDASTQQRARDAGIEFRVILPDVKPTQQLYLFELHDESELPAEWTERALFRSGRKVVLEMSDDEARFWAHRGPHPVRLTHDALGFERPAEPLVAYDCTFKPMISEILGMTSQAQWIDWIEHLSGVDPTTVSGIEAPIETRYSSSMFTGAANAKGYDFVREQALSWHWPAANVEEDSFSGSGGTWKNLVLTIPGQVNPSQSVLLTGHLDSIWFTGNSSVSAPGANDNGTGSATILEIARLFRQYRFNRTVKLIFFTGEEEGLIGSAAYTNDHSMTGIQGVLNLDMFGYDGNGDRCFEIHAGTLSASLDIANCMRDSITTYGTSLSRDYLTSTATDRSDHSSFWNKNVGAIEIAENFFNDSQPGGCVGSDPNPHYHTDQDTIALNMTPSFGFDIARTAMATISAMAIPTEKCFSAAPALTVTPAVAAMDLSWTPVPGASTYRVYRSTQSCQGQFFEVASTAGTSVTDPGLLDATYSYYVEAVHADGFCVSAPSNCAASEPTIYRALATSAAYTDSCAGGPGDHNGILEPGETIAMDVTLENTGNASLTGISGNLTTTTPGVAVTDASGSWPDLSAGSSSPTSNPFELTIDPSLTCGTTIDLSVQSTASQGSFTTPLQALIGNPPTALEQHASPDVPKAISNLTTITSSTVIASTQTVVDVNVQVDVQHNADRDLDVFLIAPNGTRVELTTDNGGTGNDFTNTVFDDEATQTLQQGNPPYTGSFKPEGSLATLDGVPANGTWKLEVTDDATNNVGNLLGWRLDLTLTVPPVCNVCDALLPPAEVAQTDWSGAKDTLDWTSVPSAVTYKLYRGTRSDLPHLLDATIDSCTRLTTGALTSGPILTEIPAPSSFYWYLVRAENAAGQGSAGNATAGPRVLDSSGSCP